MKLLSHTQKKDRIFYSYLISYLVISVITLLFSIVGYLSCERIIQKEILNSQSYMLSQLQNSFDHYVSTVMRINKTLSGNVNIQSLMNNAGFAPDDLLELNELKKELANCKKSIDYSSDIGVYLYKSDSFINSEKRYASEINYMYTELFNVSKDDFVNFLDIPQAQGYKIMINGNEPLLFFIQNIYSYNYKTKMATIFTIVPWHRIAENIASFSNGQVFWINSENQILKGIDNSISLDSISYNDFHAENQLIDIRIDRDTYIGSFKKSQYFDIKYCVLILKNSYFKPISYLKLIIAVQTVVVLLIAVALSFYYSVRNYNPISRIIKLFRSYYNISDDSVNFDKIGNYLENLLAENRTLANSWKRAQAELSNQFVAGFIKGWNTDIEILRETMSKTESITLKEAPYIVLLASYSDISNCNLDNVVKLHGRADTYQLLQYVFNDVFSKNLLSKFSGMLCSFEGTYVCIINTDGSKENRELLKNSVTECINWYKETLNLNLVVGASGIHNDFELLPKAYNEASQIVSYQLFWGEASEALMFYDESSTFFSSENKSMVQFLDNEKKLHNLLIAKDYEKAYELLDQILEESFIQDINYMGINQCRMYSLIDTFFSSLGDVFKKDNNDFFEKLKLVNRMMEANSIDAAKKVMHDIFDDIIKYVKENSTAEQPKWLTDIVEYVDKNYSDPNLNISIISDHIGMNLTYVGRTFKKYFGCGLIDYIHIRRIKECKRLLEEGQSVKEAALAVGYIDSRTLIRIFKKYEGITPGQFKNKCLA